MIEIQSKTSLLRQNITMKKGKSYNELVITTWLWGDAESNVAMLA